MVNLVLTDILLRDSAFVGTLNWIPEPAKFTKVLWKGFVLGK